MKRGVSISLYSNGSRHQHRWAYAFKEGLERHGLKADVYHPEHPVETDIVVTWGMHHHKVNQLNSRHLVLEAAYFRDRLEFASAGWGGLNGRADFRNQDSPSDRWEKHGVELKDWKSGDVALLIGQVPGDASHAHADLEAWYREVADHIPVVFRPHPKGAPRVFPSCEVSNLSLEEDLERASVVITFSSNTGVDAALSGVPVIAFDEGSMAWDIAGHDLNEIKTPDRTQWAYNLAYCQWTEDEIKAGEAWEHLNDL